MAKGASALVSSETRGVLAPEWPRAQRAVPARLRRCPVRARRGPAPLRRSRSRRGGGRPGHPHADEPAGGDRPASDGPGAGGPDRRRHPRQIRPARDRREPPRSSPYDRTGGSTTVEVGQPLPPLAGMTLARALDRLGSPAARLKETVTAPAVDCSLFLTSQRCTPADAPAVAGMFAHRRRRDRHRGPGRGHPAGSGGARALRVPVRAADARDALRHGPARVPSGRGRCWRAPGRVKTSTSVTSPSTSRTGWGAWSTRWCRSPSPTTRVRSLVRDCLTWHVDLLRRAGDTEAAGRATGMLEAFS